MTRLDIRSAPSDAATAVEPLDRPEPTATRPSWVRRDWLALAALLLVAVLIRGAGLTEPDQRYFDENFYAQDACTYVLSHTECGFEEPVREMSWGHPPLGKWLIGAGIVVFGYDPFGWRITALLAGVLTVGLLYVLARRLLCATWPAVLASGLLAVDFLHIVQSRVAMLDVFLTLFLVAALLCWHVDRASILGPARSDRLVRPWQLAAGTCAGLAAATKWSGALVLPVLVVLTVLDMRRAGPGGRAWGRLAQRQAASILLAFAVVPAVVYGLTFLGRIDGHLLAWPWEENSWPRQFLARQRGMARYHAEFEGHTHIYGSPAWSWPLLKRPVVYFFEETRSGQYREVLAFGNPLLWWTGLVALAAGTVRWMRRRAGDAERVAVLMVGLLTGSFLVVGLERPFIFLFYFVAALPFLYLALANEVQRAAGRVRVIGASAIVVGSLAGMAFFFPLVYGVPLPYEGWRQRILFEACDERQWEPPPNVAGQPRDDRKRPVAKAIPPPEGWCWI